MGANIEDLEGYTILDENNLKRQHLLSIQKSVIDFAPIIAAKNFMLMRAPPSRAFYLGDNPVSLHNSENFGFYGNIGLAVRGIEIYMPLSSELVLCALCPSVAERLKREWNEGEQERKREIGAALMSGKITISQAIHIRETIKPLSDKAELTIKNFETGGTIDGGVDQVDFINSLQTRYASRFVICKKANLSLAKRYNKEFPKFRAGVQIKTD